MSAPTTRAPAPNPDLPAADLAVPATPNRIAPQQLTGAQSVVRSLEELGVEVIFGIPAAPSCRCTTRSTTPRNFVTSLVRHEQGAGTPPAATRTRQARSACAWPLQVPARPTS